MVSRCGHVWSRHTGHLLRLHANHHGYLRVWLYNEQGVRSVHRVHHLVLKAFGPPHLNGPEVDHLDRNRMNNCYQNLEWVTRHENLSRRDQALDGEIPLKM